MNIGKTQELVVDFSRERQFFYTHLDVSGAVVERITTFKYLAVVISGDLTFIEIIKTQTKKHLHRLRQQQRKFGYTKSFLF